MSTDKAREWWASLTQDERDELIIQAWPLPKPEYSTTIKEAFRLWIGNRVYVDGGRNYRLRPEAATPTHRPSGKVAPWNKEVKRLFPSCAEFHEAATEFCTDEQRLKEAE